MRLAEAWRRYRTECATHLDNTERTIAYESSLIERVIRFFGRNYDVRRLSALEWRRYKIARRGEPRPTSAAMSGPSQCPRSCTMQSQIFASSWVLPPASVHRGAQQGKITNRRQFLRWLDEAEQHAGLPKMRMGAWRPYRRKWAVEGYPNALKTYQQPDPDTILAVMNEPSKLGEQWEAEESRGSVNGPPTAPRAKAS